MEDFTVKLRTTDHLFDAETAKSLGKCLRPIHRARDGQVVAIRMRYMDMHPHPVRTEPPLFIVRAGDTFREMDYSELPPSDRSPLSNALMWLESDTVFEECMADAMQGRTAEGRSHDLLLSVNSIALFRLDVAYCSFRGWREDTLDQFCRMVCLRADSARDALGRQEELVWLSCLWRDFTAGLPVPEPACPVPPMREPSVIDLLAPPMSAGSWSGQGVAA